MRGLVGLLFLAGCGNPSPVYTLYRDSEVATALGKELRVHWATFDAAETGEYNRENCRMAARLLNGNARSLNGDRQAVRFWCVAGRA